MIRQELYIDKYDWDLVVLYKANQDLSVVADELWAFYCPAKLALQALKVITYENTGFCYTNDLIKSTLICVAEADSDDEFVNTVVHEVRHMQSHICSYYGISEKGEEAAYLVGDTFRELYKRFKYELDEFKDRNRVGYKNKSRTRNYRRISSECAYGDCKLAWSECHICGSSNS